MVRRRGSVDGGGGHDLWGGGRGGEGGGLRWQGKAREIEYIIASNRIPPIREIERLDNPFYYLILIIPNLISSISNEKSSNQNSSLCSSFSTTGLILSKSAMTTSQGSPFCVFLLKKREKNHIRAAAHLQRVSERYRPVKG